MPIDIGSAATDRSGTAASGNTNVDLNNPANADGVITQWECYFLTGGSATGVKFGTLYGSGTSYTPRDYETIGTVSGGSIQTFSSLSCNVQTSDYQGWYDDNTIYRLEMDSTGGLGQYRLAGDQWSAGTQTYSAVGTTRIFSLYGTGVTAGVYVNVLGVWKQATMFAKDGGSWRACSSLSTKVSGVWKTIPV